MRPVALAAVALALVACSGVSEPSTSGLSEPVRVRFTPYGQSQSVPATFVPGPLPPPGDGPAVRVENNQTTIFPGVFGKKLSGYLDDSGSAVLLRFDGLGSGYWSVPSGSPADPGVGAHLLAWAAAIDFSTDLPVGPRSLQAIGVDPSGRRGPLNTEAAFNVVSDVPAGVAVVQLRWDTNSDLDLIIIGPDGKQLDPKHPSTATARLEDGGLSPGAGELDGDSNANCVIDARRRENVVWATAPMAGRYVAKADMFASCGESVANFEFRIYQDGALKFSQVGRLLGSDADNGATADPAAEPGTRAAASALTITEFQF
ncbi:MAG TPA: hypothetical protein VJT73_06480 [Polyangiaceae bacterium]|nr:hypothetical protein [Polyangiaceae bacterium]